MRQGTEIESDMRHCHFLNLTCHMGINKQQRHETLPFLKIDRRHGDPPPVKGPCILKDHYVKGLLLFEACGPEVLRERYRYIVGGHSRYR